MTFIVFNKTHINMHNMEKLYPKVKKNHNLGE